MKFPPAYHITWGTYGTGLRGGEAPYVDRLHNVYGTPLPKPNPIVEAADRARMKQSRVFFTLEQRKLVEDAITEVVERYEWKIHTMAAQSDHVHVVITAPREGEALRDALKAVASRALNRAYQKQEWWAEKGSARYLWEPAYFQNAIGYVARQREF